MWIVYILKCADGKFYTGCTSDFDDRIKRHDAGHVPGSFASFPRYLHCLFGETESL
jgi:putative endonuclease